MAARLGGGEFAVLLPDTEPEEARTTASRLFDALSEKMRLGSWPVTVSAGLVAYSEPPVSIDTALKEAGAAMYGQKTNGKNGIAYRRCL